MEVIKVMIVNFLYSHAIVKNARERGGHSSEFCSWLGYVGLLFSPVCALYILGRSRKLSYDRMEERFRAEFELIKASSPSEPWMPKETNSLISIGELETVAAVTDELGGGERERFRFPPRV